MRRRILKHVQVREYLRTLATGGVPGSPAPSERELVERFGVARMTVRQAMDALVAEGLLQRIPGRGTYFARPRRAATPAVGFTEEMARRGLQAQSHTMLARLEHAGPGVARALGLREGAEVVHWRRLRRADGSPVCIEDLYVDDALVPGLLEQDLPTSFYAELAARNLRPTWVEDAVSADVATEEEADLLDLLPGSPVLRRQRRALADDRIVEICRSAYRSDRYTMRLQLGRTG